MPLSLAYRAKLLPFAGQAITMAGMNIAQDDFLTAPDIIRRKRLRRLPLQRIAGIVAAGNGLRLHQLAAEIGVRPADLSILDTANDRPRARHTIAEALGVSGSHGDRPK